MSLRPLVAAHTVTTRWRPLWAGAGQAHRRRCRRVHRCGGRATATRRSS